MKKRLAGILLSAALALVFLMVFFGKIIRDPNNVYFSTSGDGLKAYYVALYHVRYDSVNFRTSGMNYPFGELLPFTDGQPPVVNSIRFISRNIADISDYTVAIINLLMLLSIVVGAVFLCLILMESEVAWWYAAVVAVGIAFLSPQIGRLGGHFSLAWECWIPLMAWLIIRFEKSRLWIYALLMGVTTYLAGLMHFYFLGFFGFLTGGYWFFRFIYYKKESTFWYRDLLYFSVQYLIPVLLLQFQVFFNDEVTDRPSYPFGFQSSMAHPVGVFFPSGAPWIFVPQVLAVFKHISWESFSYIGTVALAGLATGLFLMFRRICRKEIFHKVNHVRMVNVLFWISVFALLFSFGFPFVFGLKNYADQIGFFRQLRVLARFSWLFYYFINIVVFAALYQRAYITHPGVKWKILAFFAVIMIWIEGAYNANGIGVQLNNKIPELADRQNILPADKWANDIKASDYQAIIPLPYFHIGSENLWVDGTDESKKNTLLVSLKTGLPTVSVILSRTSLSQTFMNDALFREPLQRLELVDFLPDDYRPFLICRMNSYVPSEAEEWLLKSAVMVRKSDKFTLYSLPVSSVKSLHEMWRREIFDRFESEKMFLHGGYYVSDSLAYFKCVSFDKFGCATPMAGKGAYTFHSGKWHPFYSDTLKNVGKGTKMVIGFWIFQYQKDGRLRSNLEIIRKNSDGKETGPRIYTDFFRQVKAYQGDWALIELEMETISNNEILELSVRNNVIPRAEFVLDELLIREKGTDIWQQGNKFLIYNGRKFQKRKF